MKKCRHINIWEQTVEGKDITILHESTNRVIIEIIFSMPENKFWTETLLIDNFVGDTPQKLADSLQGWVDRLRTL